jgi:hypothetical protein
VLVALSLIGTGTYRLGTGDAHTPRDGESDCAGFAICRCYGLRRNRPGFNAGSWATVSDDINVNSAIEDADHHRDLFERSDRPRPGDLLCYPTIRLPGYLLPWIGHVAIVVGVGRALEWDPEMDDWGLIDVVQCRGPNGRRPAIVASTGLHWVEHDRTWPKPEHRSVLLRVVP